MVIVLTLHRGMSSKQSIFVRVRSLRRVRDEFWIPGWCRDDFAFVSRIGTTVTALDPMSLRMQNEGV